MDLSLHSFVGQGRVRWQTVSPSVFKLVRLVQLDVALLPSLQEGDLLPTKVVVIAGVVGSLHCPLQSHPGGKHPEIRPTLAGVLQTERRSCLIVRERPVSPGIKSLQPECQSGESIVISFLRSGVHHVLSPEPHVLPVQTSIAPSSPVLIQVAVVEAKLEETVLRHLGFSRVDIFTPVI